MVSGCFTKIKNIWASGKVIKSLRTVEICVKLVL